MSLLLRTHIKLAVSSLRLNRGRTFLTSLGIAIGVAAIVLILSLAGGINRLVTSQINQIGADLIVVRPNTSKNTIDSIVDELTTSNQYLKSNLTLQDVSAIQSIPTVSSVSPIATIEAPITIGDRTVSATTLVATNPEITNILSLPVKTGQFLNEKLPENTAVIGYNLAMHLFGSADSVTQTFYYQEHQFMIIGILDQLDDPINFNNVDFDNAILINADYTATFANLQIQQINLRSTTVDDVPKTVAEVQNTLSESRNGGQDFSVLSGSQISHPAGSLFSIISGMLTLVASISLIVGGIGIMNIMLVSVSERTREIGIRKAVGASSGNILLQFLFESLILSFMGSVLGFGLGYVLAFLISLITPFSPFISWQIIALTGIVAIIIGVIFGIYPAIKAARKNPIESLKYYR